MAVDDVASNVCWAVAQGRFLRRGGSGAGGHGGGPAPGPARRAARL